MKSFDLALIVFARINDFLPKDTVTGLKNAMQMDGAETFALKHGPANYANWSRDIHIIQGTIEIIGEEQCAAILSSREPSIG